MLRFLHTHRQYVGLLAILVGIAFLPNAAHPFLSLDDNYLIYENPVVKTMTPAHIWHVFMHFDPQLYIPLTFISWQLNAVIFGLHPTSFHVMNILLHLGNAILLFAILKKLGAKDIVALGVAALFAVHPLQVESVLWATGRKDVLSAFFALASLLQYLRYRDGVRKALLWSAVLFACALLSKISIVLLPLLFLAIDWVQKRPMDRSALREKIPFGILAVLFLLIAVLGKSTELGSSGTLINLLLPAKSVVFYLTKVFYPVGLSVIYPFTAPENLIASFAVYVGIVGILGILGILFLYRRHSPALALPLVVFFLFLAPSFTTYWKNGYLYFASDRYAYLAIIGIFWLLVEFVDALSYRVQKQSLTPIIVGIAVIVLVPLTWAQGEVWSSSVALYQNVLRFYPDSVMAETNLGMEWNRSGDLVAAKKSFERAVTLDPFSTIPQFNLAGSLEKEGNDADAKAIYLHIVEIVSTREINSPADVRRFLWLIQKLTDIGESDAAFTLTEKLTIIAPSVPEFWHVLGVRERMRGNDEQAFTAFLRARDEGSRDPVTYYHLAELSDAQGRTNDVQNYLQQGIRLDPDNEDAKALLETYRTLP